MTKLLTLLALSVSISGCSMLPYYDEAKAIAKQGVYTAIEDRQKWNDVKADALLALPCAASLGSVMRMGDTRKQAILIELCGGPAADSQITVEDMAAMMKIMQP